jgi:FKBP-type peptidyl-prolyl cis-trans isomerase 2
LVTNLRRFGATDYRKVDELIEGNAKKLLTSWGLSQDCSPFMQMDDENVRIDANHPLAGSVLSFEVEVVNIEKARTTITSTAT